MKHANQFKTLFLLLGIGMLTLGSCLKGSEPTEIQVAKLAFLNASPASEGFDMGLDQRLVNGISPDNPDFAYGDTLGYFNAFPGQRWVRVFENAHAGAQPLARGAINLAPGEAYTVYVVGYDELGLIATSDDLSEPESGKAKIRFINLSPDAPSLDFGIRGAQTLIGSDKEFKKYSGFVEVDAGEAYTFDISLHEGGDFVHSFGLELGDGGIYTVWAKGMLEDDGDPSLAFGHGLMTYRTPPPTTEE